MKINYVTVYKTHDNKMSFSYDGEVFHLSGHGIQVTKTVLGKKYYNLKFDKKTMEEFLNTIETVF